MWSAYEREVTGAHCGLSLTAFDHDHARLARKQAMCCRLQLLDERALAEREPLDEITAELIVRVPQDQLRVRDLRREHRVKLLLETFQVRAASFEMRDDVAAMNVLEGPFATLRADEPKVARLLPPPEHFELAGGAAGDEVVLLFQRMFYNEIQ
jgi:uncharacterized protein (DUF885 family)